jgi:SAM-dependent methyltransferase
VKGKTVLDIASGEGYGSHLISKVALSVTGVDISEEAVAHAASKYATKTNLNFKVGSASAIPLEDSSVDIVTSFETLEHTTEHEEFLKEIKRVLKPDGILIMSTPDTVLYNPHDPDNPYHVKELTTEEFKSLIRNHFEESTFLNQRSVIGTFIQPHDSIVNGFKSYSGSYSDLSEGFGNDAFYGKPLFNIVIASDNKVEMEIIQKSTLFNYVPEMLNEFKDSIGLMFQLKEYKKLADRLEELEKSRSFKFSKRISLFVNILKRSK